MENQHEYMQKEENLVKDEDESTKEESQINRTFELEPLQDSVHIQALSCWKLEDPVDAYMGS